MAETQNTHPVKVITDGISYFLTGGFLIGTPVMMNNPDIVYKRLAIVSQVSGYLILAFGVFYILPAIPWFGFLLNFREKIDKYTYPFLFGTTSAQVFRIVFDSNQSNFLRWASGIFSAIITAILMFFNPVKAGNKKLVYLQLIMIYNILAGLYIGLRAENLSALLAQPNLEPLLFITISLVFIVLLMRQVVKGKEKSG